MSVALDTNLLVRLLTNDDIAQAEQVHGWLRAHATPQAPAYIDHVVLCELSWVLQRSYGYPRTQVHAALAALLDSDILKVEAPTRVREALEGFAAGPADFSDFLIAARSRAAGHQPVLTFDRNAAKSATHRLLA